MRHGRIPVARRLAACAVVACLALSFLDMASGVPADSPRETSVEGDGALGLTGMDWFVWDRHDPENSHLMVWVNVTNPGGEPATGLRGEMRGADPAYVHSAYLGSMSGSVARGGSSTNDFFVLPRTTTTVSASISSSSFTGQLGLEVTSPTGKSFQAPPAGAQASVTLTTDAVNEGAFGLWTATVSHAGGVRGFSYTLNFEVEFADDGAENVTLAQLPAGANYQLYFNIWADEPYPTLPPNLSIWLNGTVVGEGGPRQVSYVVGGEGPAQEATPSGAGGPSGEFPVGPALALAAGVALVVVLFVFRAPLKRRTSSLKLPAFGGKGQAP
jgi:hypothetical protein